MDPKQSLILMFIMPKKKKKKSSGKAKKRRQESIIQLLTVKIFSVYFNSESTISLFTDVQF